MKLLRVIGLLVMGIVACKAMASPAPGIPNGWSDGFVYANGIRIHYYHAVPAPGKPVIVMVHGVTDNGLCWTTLTEDIQKSYDIYMLDSRGHGLSDPFTDADNGDTLTKDVVGFVHVMKFEKPILLGHSMGAATVMRIGAEYPDLPRAVIMLDPLLGLLPGPAPGAPAAPARSGRSAAAPRGLSMFGSPEALVAQNNEPFDDLVATCRRQNPKWDPVDCQYWALSKKQYHGPYSATQMRAMTGTMAIGDSLAKITAPALILKADAPPEVRKATEKIVSVMKNGKMVYIDGAAHNLHHDQRKRTVEVLNEFLDTLDFH
ncbi:MAG TPA: alpha/beta hydrolase [Terriglobales bacterium]|nr:alpha/beta hydrolase [Terriglobales bacterium]